MRYNREGNLVPVQGKAQLSRRAWTTVKTVMPRIRGAVAERSKTQTENIDLSTAENRLIRPDIIVICKESITENLDIEVSLALLIQFSTNVV